MVSPELEYKYDVRGRRIEKDVNDTITKYLYDGSSLIAEYAASDTLQRNYFYGAGDINPSILYEGSSVYFYHHDHLNTPQAITDESGTIVWEADYKSFGEVNLTIEVVKNNFRFPGQYYDPITGRYLREDPIGFAGGDVNLYSYVANNPIYWVDPWGFKVWKCKRPLGGKPGKKGLHHYNCITLIDGSVQCDSTSAGPNWPREVEPGVPSDPSDDYYHKDSCDEVDDDKDDCVERCLERTWQQPRPNYDIGPFGTDCQEYSRDTLESCVKQCSSSP